MTDTFSAPVWIALIVAVSGTIVGPFVASFIASRSRTQEKKEDYRRHDEVAAKLTAKTEETARLLVESNKLVAKTAVETQGQLSVIHTLVNSNMTASMRSDLLATKRGLVSLNEIVRLNRISGQEPSEDTQAEIRATEAKVAELESAIADRFKQSAEVGKARS